jgi:O-antigen/teichoic acid export membrane protein
VGSIRKQSILITIFAYLGVGLGYVNVVLLFPRFFSPEEFGLTRVLVAAVGILSQFALFGMANSIIRFFPFFKSKEAGHNGLLARALVLGLVGIGITSMVLLLFKPYIVSHYMVRSSLVADFYILLFPFLAFEVLFQVFRGYARALQYAVIDTIYREILLRFLTMTLILLTYFGVIDFEQFMWLFVGQYGLTVLGMVAYLFVKNELHLEWSSGFLTPQLKKDIIHYSGFTILSGVGSVVLINIDVLMIQQMVGLDQVAFYAVAFYIVAVINIPRNAIGNIAVPIISDAWKRNDMVEIQSIYEKTAINQLLIGVLLFIGIWANHETLFYILPEEYADGKWVLFFVGIARLIDVGFGINGGIMTNSPYYRFDTYAGFALIFVTIIANLIFIPPYGISGAAIATGISLFFMNLSRFVVLKWKYSLNPFSHRTMLTLVLAAASYGVSTFIPQLDNVWFDLMVRSGVICVVFIPLAIALNLSVDGNKFLLEILLKVRK